MKRYTVYVSTTEVFDIEADSPEEAMEIQREGGDGGYLHDCQRWVELEDGQTVEDQS
jgi:hypothetical protein